MCVLHTQRQEQARVMAEMTGAAGERTDARIIEEWNNMRSSIGDRIAMAATKRRQSAHATLILKQKGISGKDVDADKRSETIHSMHSAVAAADSDLVGCSELYNALHAGIVRPYIHDAEYMLLIDARSHDAFAAGHINTAQHMSMLNPFIPLSEYSLVIVYDDDGAEKGPGAAFQTEILSRGAMFVTLLAGGFNKFSKRYPFLCQDQQTHLLDGLAEREQLLSFPSEIRVQQIYLGNYLHAHSEDVIAHLGITHILNATTQHENKFPAKVTYCTLKVADVPDEDILSHFERGANFIRKAVRSRGRVLVHCTMGVSRSSTLLIAYFIKFKKWTIAEALEYISDRRQGIKPNAGFLKQLSEWEKQILGDKRTDVEGLFI